MIYLASVSPRRRLLLKQAKISCRVLRPKYHEKMIAGYSPKQLTLAHAEKKAMSVVPRVRQGVILSADTVVSYQGKILGKPKTMAQAFRMLKALSGHWHTVITGVAVLKMRGGNVVRRLCFTESTRVFLRKLDESQLKLYMKRIGPLDKAGAYAIQKKGATLVKTVRGSWSNAVGLPMEKLKKKLVMLR